MKRILSLVLAFLMIFGVFSFPVSADEEIQQMTGEYLQKLGIIKGDEKGDLNTESNLTREEAISILVRMLGKSEEAKSGAADSGFSDVDPKHWAAKDITYAKKAGLTSGMGDGTFGLKRKVTSKEIASFMLRALGHSADWAKEDIMAKADSLKLLGNLTLQENSYIIRGEVFVMMKNTLYTNLKDSEELLAKKLGYDVPTPNKPEKEEKEEKVEEDSAVIGVEEVQAQNLKEIEIKFNSKVDKASLNSAFRMIGSGLGNLTPVLVDEKTVHVKVQNAMTNRKSYKLEIAKVKNLSGDMLDKEVFEFTAEDKLLPTALEVSITGPKNIDLKFNEPIKTLGSVEIKNSSGRKVVANPMNFTAGDEVIHLHTAGALKEGESYHIAIDKFGDFAGYVSTFVEKNFKYVKMTQLPTVKVVSATAEYVELEFSAPVKNMMLEHFYHSFNAWKPIAAYKSLETMNANLSNKLSSNELKDLRDRVVLRFIGDVQNYIKNTPAGEHPLVGDSVPVFVRGKVGSTAIMDSWGNQLENYEEKVSIQTDKTAPEIVSIESVSDKDILVKFSKDITFKASNYKVKNANGTSLGFSTNVTKDSSKSVKITLNSSNLAGKTFKVQVEEVMDATIAQNRLNSAEQYVKFEDRTFSGMKEALFIAGDGSSEAKIRVRFDEAVDANSALETSNYKLKVSGAIKPISFALNSVNADVIEFSVSKEEWVKSGVANTATMPVGLELSMSNNVTDVIGNKISSFEQTLSVSGTSVAPAVVNASAQVTSRNQIVFYFDQQVSVESGWDYEKFSVTGLGKLSIQEIDESTVSGQTRITLKLSENVLSSDMTGKSLSYTGAMPKNSLGVAHVWADLPLVDKVEPQITLLPTDLSDPFYTSTDGFTPATGYTIAQVVTGEVAVGAKELTGAYFVILCYDEAIDVHSISTTTYGINVPGVEISGVSVLSNPKLVSLQLSQALNDDQISNFVVTQLGSIKDSNGNVKSAESVGYTVQPVFGANLK